MTGTVNRRKFLKGSALAATATAATLAAPSIAKAEPTVIKMQAAGGGGGWRDSRAALFWAALVAAPVMLAGTLLSLLLTGVPGQTGAIAGMLGAVAFAWAVAQCISEAHGFTSAWRVLAAVAGLAAALVGGVYLLGHL